ncbi:hypothetical protein [Streptococcus suis]
MTKHEDFINSPIESVMMEALSAISSINTGIETYPLNEYLLKTIFLQMTGFQEQKFKCIVWEMATEDFEFRRDFLRDYATQGFSTYDSKKSIYQKLMILLDRDEFSESDRKVIVEEAKDIVCKIFDESNIQYWNGNTFIEFKGNIKNKIGYKCIARKGTGYNLLESEGQKAYDKLYRHRNRLAHNTLSYQRNLPTLQELENKEFGDSNYFIWFYILIVIDKIMIKLFNEFNKATKRLLDI